MLITTERQPRIRGEEEADRCLRGLATFCSKIRQLLERKSGRLAGWRASSVLYTRGRCGGANYRDTWRRNLPNDSSSDSPSNNKEIIPRRDNFLSLSCDYIHRTCFARPLRFYSWRPRGAEIKSTIVDNESISVFAPRTFQLRACPRQRERPALRRWKKETLKGEGGRRNQLYKCLRVHDTTLVGERTATMPRIYAPLSPLSVSHIARTPRVLNECNRPRLRKFITR